MLLHGRWFALRSVNPANKDGPTEMCGILARINPVGLKVAVDECRRATAMVIHRGPDAHGEWISEHENVYLGLRSYRAE